MIFYYSDGWNHTDFGNSSDFGLETFEFKVNSSGFGLNSSDFGLSSSDFGLDSSDFGDSPMDKRCKQKPGCSFKCCGKIPCRVSHGKLGFLN